MVMVCCNASFWLQVLVPLDRGDYCLLIRNPKLPHTVNGTGDPVRRDRIQLRVLLSTFLKEINGPCHYESHS
jgi:hypothetical protein